MNEVDELKEKLATAIQIPRWEVADIWVTSAVERRAASAEIHGRNMRTKYDQS
jgi:hypothetical protein